MHGATTASAAGRYDPRLRFRTIRTPHFDIHAHQGEEAMARRLAAIAERVRVKFQPDLGVPRGRVQIILVDQTDVSNGWATPLPYDTIEITAVPPASESLIGNTTDWLELVFTHEYTHILHLDRSRGLLQGVRRVFGRVPPAFPNGFLPPWQVEGIATYEESRMTGEGRVPAGDFRAIVDVAAARGRFETIDRAAGGLIDWPSGQAPYAYGAYFHQYLADKYGAERLAQLADATAGRIPFFGGGAFKNVFGRSTRELWQDFRADRERAGLPHSDTDARATRLTRHGFVVTAPRAAAGGSIYYGVSNAHGFPALMELPRGGAPRRIAWRAGGNRTSVRGEWVVFDQLQRVRSVALYSDLYAVRTAGGPVHRLTRDARAGDPDLSPDGRRIVCTVQATGRRGLALLDFSPSATSAPAVLVDDPAADFTGPRWSPDGRQIVVARRRAGVYELVLIDPETRALRVLVARSDARVVTPAWTADGATVLFAADPPDQAFNIFAVDAATGAVRPLTDTAGGAQFPEVAPDGSLIYVGYTPDGYDLFSVPIDAGFFRLKAEATRVESRELEAGSRELEAGSRELEAGSPAGPPSRGFRLQAEGTPSSDRPYSPWRTLVPTAWSPIVSIDADEVVIGAAVGTVDALGRHAYALDGAWASGRARPDWHAAYAYDRWRPTLFASYSDDTDPVGGGRVRSRELLAGAQLSFRHIRWSETLLGAFDAQTDTAACPETDVFTAPCAGRAPRRDLRSLRAGWLHDSRRVFGYSISAEEGFAIEAATESSRTALGSDADAAAAIFDARAFRRLFGHTVVAGRIGAAAGWGPLRSRRRFAAGGAGPSELVFDFGRDSIGLLRGFAADELIGSRAAAANLDVRFPIARIQRGVGAWPIFFRTLHGAVFADAGHAWDVRFRLGDVRGSAGAELSLDLVVLHYLPLTIVSGAAWIDDPVAGRRGAAFFARLGHAF